MTNRMVTLHLEPSMANLDAVSAKYALRPHEVDKNFGVVSVSPESGLYAILIDEDAAARIEGSDGMTGTFSNPRIEPFGPPKS